MKSAASLRDGRERGRKEGREGMRKENKKGREEGRKEKKEGRKEGKKKERMSLMSWGRFYLSE